MLLSTGDLLFFLLLLLLLLLLLFLFFGTQNCYVFVSGEVNNILHYLVMTVVTT